MATAVIITVGHSVAGKFYVLLMAMSQKRVLEANTFLWANFIAYCAVCHRPQSCLFPCWQSQRQGFLLNQSFKKGYRVIFTLQDRKKRQIPHYDILVQNYIGNTRKKIAIASLCKKKGNEITWMYELTFSP